MRECFAAVQFHAFCAVSDAFILEAAEKLLSCPAELDDAVWVEMRESELVEAWEAEELVLEDGAKDEVEGFAG